MSTCHKCGQREAGRHGWCQPCIDAQWEKVLDDIREGDESARQTSISDW